MVRSIVADAIMPVPLTIAIYVAVVALALA
jgi:hypothetical protein